VVSHTSGSTRDEKPFPPEWRSHKGGKGFWSRLSSAVTSVAGQISISQGEQKYSFPNAQEGLLFPCFAIVKAFMTQGDEAKSIPFRVLKSIPFKVLW